MREVIAPASLESGSVAALLEVLGDPAMGEQSEDRFDPVTAESTLVDQLGTDAIESLSRLERTAAGALLARCRELRGNAIPQVTAIERLTGVSYLSLDTETIGNLELFEAPRGGDPAATLVRAMDRTLTALGARELRRWIEKPLCDIRAIDERLDAVEALHSDAERLECTAAALKGIADVQRLAARIASGKAIPRELHALRESLEKIPALRSALSGSGASPFERAIASLGEHRDLCEAIERTIVPDPPGHLRDGGVIRRGCDPASFTRRGRR